VKEVSIPFISGHIVITELLTIGETLENSGKELLTEFTELGVNTLKILNNGAKSVLLDQEIGLEIKESNRDTLKKIGKKKEDLRLEALNKSLEKKK